MGRVVVIALPGADVLDLSAVSGCLGSLPGQYSVDVCTSTDWPVRSSAGFTVAPTVKLDAARRADTIVVVGHGPAEPAPKTVLRTLQAAARRGARIVGTGVGVFTLARAGLVDHRPVTTHWQLCRQLGELFPTADVQADRLVVVDPAAPNGPQNALVTGAGSAATVDLCLELVCQDVNAQTAAEVARRLLVAPARLGGQSAFAGTPSRVPRSVELTEGCAWAGEHLSTGIGVADLVQHVGCSARTLQRWFLDELGVTPLAWLTEQRMERAKALLADSDLPVREVGVQVGLPSASAFRARFGASVGMSPSDYRRTYRGSDHP